MFDIKMSTYKKLCYDYNYKGIAFDNNYIYITIPNRYEIIRYSQSLEEIDTYCVRKGYSVMCYDNYYNCFWATNTKEKNKIYKLDNYFNEISVIYIKFKGCREFTIEKIICKEKCKLTLCGEFGQIDIEKEEKCIYIEEEDIEKDIYTCNCVELENHLLYCSGNKNKSWKICDYNNNQQRIKYPLHCDYNIIDITNSDFKCTKCKYIYILAKKLCGSTYIIKLEVYQKEFCSCECDCYNESKCNYTDECNKKLLCGDGAADIIQSIALMEASLSHILNAEGEKIQKILCSTDNTCDIIKVNESVNKTIINISHLEQILYSKLVIANELCNCTENMEECMCNNECSCDCNCKKTDKEYNHKCDCNNKSYYNHCNMCNKTLKEYYDKISKNKNDKYY